ncbi:Putative transcriptional regulator, BolA superfamily [Idiomarina sp. A28L]|uniref:BolA family protein n=1 Tax=Idiomarina sp. A28L TaxID=1036674 RepID=UPI0002138827|nr:BolA family protein [Idiomarina sp. A28L]EGN74868.1 Putative transcriptional regulator, BolA superfamily [Idiomarina sp. A28L]
MNPNEIEALLQEALELDEVHVSGEGSHFQVIAVSASFANLSRVKQQQMIYRPLNDKISDGTIHALSIKAYTPEKWQREKLLNMPS